MSFIKKIYFNILFLLLNTAPALAQEIVPPAAAGDATATPQAPSLLQGMAEVLPMFATIFLIFYFLVIRPQAKQLKDHETMLNTLSKGDEVISSGGIIGRVAGIEKDYILLEVASGVKIKLLTSNLVRKFEKSKKSGDTEKK